MIRNRAIFIVWADQDVSSLDGYEFIGFSYSRSEAKKLIQKEVKRYREENDMSESEVSERNYMITTERPNKKIEW